MTPIQKATKYLKETPQYVMDENDTAGYASRLVRDLMIEIKCLKIQVCDRGNNYEKQKKENDFMRYLITQILNDLPAKRDWLDPSIETGMKEMCNIGQLNINRNKAE